MNWKAIIFIAVILIVNHFVGNPLGRLFSLASGWLACIGGGVIKQGRPCWGDFCAPTADDTMGAMFLALIPFTIAKTIKKDISKRNLFIIFVVSAIIAWLIIKVWFAEILLDYAQKSGYDKDLCFSVIPIGPFGVPYELFSVLLWLAFIIAIWVGGKFLVKQFKSSP